MTIKDLEIRTGLDRATVRFYEQEGLIAPKRLPNGYRDYSEEDAQTLEKIAFLRQLGLSLEMIRTVQRGELPLGVVLEKQREIILRQQAEGEVALQLCDLLRKEGASFETLQPMKYKERLLAPRSAGSQRLPPPPKSTANGHPFMRWIARSLDMALAALLAVAFVLYILRIRFDNPLAELAVPLLGTVVGMLLEPLLLSTWGYTPGKWIMGLRLRTLVSGAEEKPTFRQAFVRYWKVQFFGNGLNLAPFTYICSWNCWKRARDGEDQPWDAYRFVYNLDRRERDASWLMWVAWGLAAAAIVFMAVDSQQPVHRTDWLTRAEYVENVNDMLEYTFDSDLELNEEGVWFSDSRSSKGDERDKLEIREENGLVTGVTMTYSLSGGKYDYLPSRRIERISAVLGLVGGRKDIKPAQLTEELDGLIDRWEGTVEVDGWVIRQWVENPPANLHQFQSFNNQLFYQGSRPLDPPMVVHFSVEREVAE